MAFNLTFKEYLKSKEELRTAFEKTPQQITEYTVSKYCKLMVGESKDDKEMVILKPNQKIVVEWLYEDIDNPTAIKIMFEGVCAKVDTEDHHSYWPVGKLQKWLQRNTITEFPFV